MFITGAPARDSTARAGTANTRETNAINEAIVSPILWCRFILSFPYLIFLSNSISEISYRRLENDLSGNVAITANKVTFSDTTIGGDVNLSASQIIFGQNVSIWLGSDAIFKSREYDNND